MITMTGKRRLLQGVAAVLLGVAACGIAVPPATAQSTGSWPDRPIKLVVPFAPGGVTDSIARLSAEWLAARLHQPFVVENRTGANGSIAVDYVARSDADGYTLLTASASQMVMLPALRHVNFDPKKDFAPISIVASNPLVLGVSTATPASSLTELVATARRNGGAFNYASAGIGSSSHLGMALLLARTGMVMNHVPYRGGAPAMQDLLAGQVNAYFGNPSDFIPQMDSGRVRVIGISAAARSSELPGVPTIAEQGFPDFRAETWNGIMAPSGVPAAIVARLAAELQPACADAQFRAALVRLGTDPVCSSQDGFAAAIDRDTPLWQEAVRISGASLE